MIYYGTLKSIYTTTVFDIEFLNDVEHGVIQIWNSSYVKISFSCFLLYLIEMKPKRQYLLKKKKKEEGSQMGSVHSVT